MTSSLASAPIDRRVMSYGCSSLTGRYAYPRAAAGADAMPPVPKAVDKGDVDQLGFATELNRKYRMLLERVIEFVQISQLETLEAEAPRRHAVVMASVLQRRAVIGLAVLTLLQAGALCFLVIWPQIYQQQPLATALSLIQEFFAVYLAFAGVALFMSIVAMAVRRKSMWIGLLVISLAAIIATLADCAVFLASGAIDTTQASPYIAQVALHVLQASIATYILSRLADVPEGASLAVSPGPAAAPSAPATTTSPPRFEAVSPVTPVSPLASPV